MTMHPSERPAVITPLPAACCEMAGLSASDKARGRTLTMYACLPGIVYYLTFNTITQNFFAALKMSPMQVGLLGSLINICGYAQLLTSVIAEHYGRKRIYLLFVGLGMAIGLAIPVLPLLAGWRPGWPVITLTFVVIVTMSLVNNLGFATWFAMIREFTDNGTRGAFFSRLRLTYGWVSLVFFLLIWLVFRTGDRNIPMWGFAMVFGIGWIAGLIRFRIVRHFPTPDNRPTESIFNHFGASIREIMAKRAFRQYLVFYGAFAFVIGLADPFIVLYAKYQLHLTDTTINLARFFWQAGGMAGLWFFGRRLGTIGVRSVYIWTAGVMIVAMLLLTVPDSGRTWAPGMFCLIFAVKGFADFGFGLASTDALLLEAAGRNPSLTIVIASLLTVTAGSIAQLISGKILTHWSGAAMQGIIPLNIYKIMFLAAGVLLMLLIAIRACVPPEPKNS